MINEVDGSVRLRNVCDRSDYDILIKIIYFIQIIISLNCFLTLGS